VPEFVVERDIPGFTAEDLRDAARRARDVATEMTGEGIPVRYHRSIFMPDEAKCFCIFDGPTAEDVRKLNERANLPVTRIHDAVEIELPD
jgi:hypothetical protein